MQVFTRSIKLILVCLFLLTNYMAAQAPSFTWVKTAGSTKLDYGNAIAVDAAGNVYVTGEFIGTVDFGNSVVLTSNQAFVDFFLVKYDPQGNTIWGTSAGGTLTDRGYGIILDKTGNIVVTGHYYGAATFGSTTLTSMGNLDAFTAKYDTSGNLIWIKDGKGVSQVSTRSIATNETNDTYVVGYFGTSTSNTVQFDNLTLTSNGQRDIFLVKYDTDGNVKWGVEAGGSNSGEEGKDVAVDDAGNVYITGMFVDTAFFGSTAVYGNGGSDIFIAKYTPDGKLVWVKSAGSPKDDVGYGITCDKSGHVYVSGKFDSTAVFGSKSYTTNGDFDAFVAKMDTAGNFIWVDTFGGTGADNCSAVRIDDAGYCVAYGTFIDVVSFGTTQLTCAGTDDVFWVKLDPSGNVYWVKQAGGSGKEGATSLALEKNGNIVSTGYYNATAFFDSFQFTSAGAQDIFVSKLASTIVPVELVSFKASVIDGKVVLKWTTATETNNSGFAVERSLNNKEFTKIGFVNGNGSTTEKSNYTFTDENLSGSKYYYRLKQIDFDGTYKFSSAIEVNLNIPAKFNLYPNYPNPFNPSTNIVFELPVASNVTITIYNSIGRELEILTNKEYQAGRNEIRFDAAKYSSGVYFYKLNAFGKDGSSFSSNRKMILMR